MYAAQGAPTIFWLYFQTAGGDLNIVFEFFAFQIKYSSIYSHQNINKRTSSTNHSATGEEQNDHYRRNLRRQARAGGNGVPQNPKDRGV